MSLARYTSPELLIPQLHGRDAAAVIAELCSTLQRAGRVKDLLAFYNQVISRELLGSTATRGGWATPHARSAEIERLCFAVGRTSEPVRWPENSGVEVHLVFLFAVPEENVDPYLNLLSGITRLTEDPLQLDGLLAALDSQAMFEVFRQIPLRKARPVPLARQIPI